MLSLLLGFALITDDPNQNVYDRQQMDITLIVINSFAFVLLILSLCGLIPCVRNRLNKRADRISRSKVIPTGGGGGDNQPSNQPSNQSSNQPSNRPSNTIRDWSNDD